MTDRLPCSSVTVYSASSAQISWARSAATGTWQRAYLAEPSVAQPPWDSTTLPASSRDAVPASRVRRRGWQRVSGRQQPGVFGQADRGSGARCFVGPAKLTLAVGGDDLEDVAEVAWS